MTGLPPAGWYDDPEHPDHLRYWSGAAWSEHRAPKQAPAPTGSSALSDIGSWLGQTFELPIRRWQPMLVLMAASIAISWLALFVLVKIWDDLVYLDGEWSQDIAGSIALSALVVIVAGVVWVTVYLAQIRVIHDARLGVHPSVGAALAAGLRAIPRLIGWGLAFVGVLIGVGVVIAILGALAPALAVIGAIVSIAVAIWAGVKLAFFGAALVVPVDGLNTVKASAEVSRDRWWSVFGRLLLLGLVVVGISLALGLVTAPVGGSPSEDDFDDVIVLRDTPGGGEELFLLDVGGVIEASNLTGVGMVVGLISAEITGLISLSGMAILYAETHQRRPQSPTPG